MTPKIDNKRPKSVQPQKSAIGPGFSPNHRSNSMCTAKPCEKTDDSKSNYFVILQKLKPDGSSSSILQEEVKNDIIVESKTFLDPPSDKNIGPTGTFEQVEEQEIETCVTLPEMEAVSESEQAIICEFSESDVTQVTAGNETCGVGEQNCEHATFTPDDGEHSESPLKFDKQFSLESKTLGDDNSTLDRETECHQDDSSAIEMGTSFSNETHFEDAKYDFLENLVATKNASQSEKNCTVPLASSGDEINDNEHDEITDHESDDKSDVSSEFEVDTSCYVNYPDDLRPSVRLPQRLTSRRSTVLLSASLLCTGADTDQDWDLEREKRGHRGCWNWLSNRF